LASGDDAAQVQRRRPYSRGRSGEARARYAPCRARRRRRAVRSGAYPQTGSSLLYVRSFVNALRL